MVLLRFAAQDAVQSKPVLLVISLSGIKVCSQTGEVRPHAATVGKLNMLVHVHVRDRTSPQMFASWYGWFIQIANCTLLSQIQVLRVCHFIAANFAASLFPLCQMRQRRGDPRTRAFLSVTCIRLDSACRVHWRKYFTWVCWLLRVFTWRMRWGESRTPRVIPRAASSRSWRESLRVRPQTSTVTPSSLRLSKRWV